MSRAPGLGRAGAHLSVVPADCPAPPADLAAMIDRIRRLHTPATVCRGCCSLTCSGECDWADEYGSELLAVCAHCCIDDYEGKQNFVCLDDHQHGSEHGPDQAICPTIAVMDGTASPAETQPAPPRVAVRQTLTETPAGGGTTGHEHHPTGPSVAPR